MLDRKYVLDGVFDKSIFYHRIVKAFKIFIGKMMISNYWIVCVIGIKHV